jgi:hypothetical protein
MLLICRTVTIAYSASLDGEQDAQNPLDRLPLAGLLLVSCGHSLGLIYFWGNSKNLFQAGNSE